MQRITNWTARRTGAGMTITGKDADGSPVKLTRVSSIDAGAAGVVATQTNGIGKDAFFELVAA